MDLYDFLGALYVAAVAFLIGVTVGHCIGHRSGSRWVRLRGLRRRRPINLTVDLDLIRYAAEGAGYDVVPKKKTHH